MDAGNQNVPPRQLSTDRKSLHYDICYKRVDVEFNGEMREADVHAYDVDEGWVDVRIRRADGRYKLTERGEYATQRLFGVVVPFWKHVLAQPAIKNVRIVTAVHDHDAAQAKAEEKRVRKMGKHASLAEPYSKR